MKCSALLVLCAIASFFGACLCDGASTYDILVYGATPGGVATAIAAAMISSNTTIAILEPSAYIGGMSVAGGIGLRDLGVESTILNSIAHMWTVINAKHYGVSYPVYQPDMWVAEKSLWTMIESFPNIKVILNSSLSEKEGVQKSGLKITSVKTSDGTEYNAKVFVDASYEGDLARFAHVNYTFGRESVAKYNEKLAGVRPYTSTGNFLSSHPSSALLNGTEYVPYVDTEPLGPVGSADERMMGYSFRLCITPVKHNHTAFFPPPGYNKKDFVLLQRYIDSLIAGGSKGVSFGNIIDILIYRNYPPGDKFDMCDSAGSAFTSDAINLNKGYVEGSYATRQQIYEKTYYYVLGLVYYLSHDVTQEFTRNSTNDYGLCADQWLDHKHIPTQMYVREGLRIVGDKVFTENDIVGGRDLNDSIAVGSWVYDVHVVSRTVVKTQNGSVVANNEGQYFTSIAGTGHAYDIPISILLPKKTEASNLIVPVCHSASHVAYSSLRVEPTFMLLGQASGVLAHLALQHDIPTQDVQVSEVQAQLTKWGISIHSSGK